MTFNYQQLYYFHIIATEGSLKAASDKTGLSSPTLSEHLKQLEKQLKQRLFERKKSRLVLNDAGLRMFRYTKIMFKAGERLRHSFTPRLLKQISIDIGICSTVSRLIATDCLSSFFSDQETHVRIKQGDYDYLVRDLINSQLDLLISEQKVALESSKEIKTELIHKSPLVVVTSAANASHVKNFEKSFENLSFLHYSPASIYRLEVDNYFSSIEVEPNVMGELDDLQLMKNALYSGIGYAILPMTVVKSEIKSKKLVLIDTLESTTAKVYVSYHKQDPIKQVLNSISSLKKLIKEHHG